MCMWFVLYVVCTVNFDLYGADQTASYNVQDWMCLPLHHCYIVQIYNKQWEGRLCVTNLSLENNLLTFWLTAPVVIGDSVQKWKSVNKRCYL